MKRVHTCLFLPVNLQNMTLGFSFLPFSLSVQLKREFSQGFSSVDHHSHISVVQFSFSFWILLRLHYHMIRERYCLFMVVARSFFNKAVKNIWRMLTFSLLVFTTLPEATNVHVVTFTQVSLLIRLVLEHWRRVFCFQDCVFLGAGGYSVTEYESIIFYHNSNPKWNETIKVHSLAVTQIMFFSYREFLRHLLENGMKWTAPQKSALSSVFKVEDRARLTNLKDLHWSRVMSLLKISVC